MPVKDSRSKACRMTIRGFAGKLHGGGSKPPPYGIYITVTRNILSHHTTYTVYSCAYIYVNANT